MIQSIGKKRNKDIFYVVTRDGRRAWPKDYWTIEEARSHADSLVYALKALKDPSFHNIVIVETSDPDTIN